MNSTEAFASVYQLVSALHARVEALPQQVILKEDARKVSRLAKRVEVLISDLQPYVGSTLDSALAQVLQEIAQCLQSMKDMVQVIGSKGPLATFFQADRMLAGFQDCVKQMEATLSAICGRLPEETQEELAAVKALLARTRFDLPPQHAATIAKFREGVDSMSHIHSKLMEACGEVLDAITGVQGSQLSKEGFHTAMKELMTEHQLLLKQGDPYRDVPYLRTMMDVMRLYHRPGEVPLAYVCPLTHQVMRDPVVLQETGQSYERRAIELWYSKGHKICPRSGKPLGWRLHLVPNTNLKEAIEQWRMYSALAVSWQPLLAMNMLAGQGTGAATAGDGVVPFINLEGSTSGAGGGMAAQLKSHASTPSSRYGSGSGVKPASQGAATPTMLSSPAAWSLPPGAVLSPRSAETPTSPRSPQHLGRTPVSASDSQSAVQTPAADVRSAAASAATTPEPAPAHVNHVTSPGAESSATKSSASSNPSKPVAPLPPPPPPAGRVSSSGGVAGPMPVAGSGSTGIPPLLSPPPPSGRSSASGAGASPAVLSPPPPPPPAATVFTSQPEADPYEPIEFEAFPEPEPPTTTTTAAAGVESTAPAATTLPPPPSDVADAAAAHLAASQQQQETEEEQAAADEQAELEFRAEWAQSAAGQEGGDSWEVPVPQPASLDSQTTVPYPAVCEPSPADSEAQSAVEELEFGAVEGAVGAAADAAHQAGQEGVVVAQEEPAAGGSDVFDALAAEAGAESGEQQEVEAAGQAEQAVSAQGEDDAFSDLVAAPPPPPAAAPPAVIEEPQGPVDNSGNSNGINDDAFGDLVAPPPSLPPLATTTTATAAAGDNVPADVFGDLMAGQLPTAATPAGATDDGFDDFHEVAPAATPPAANGGAGGFDELFTSPAPVQHDVQPDAAGAAGGLVFGAPPAGNGDDDIEWGDMAAAPATKALTTEGTAAAHSNGH